MNVTENPQVFCCPKQIVQLSSSFSKKNIYEFFSNSVSIDLEILSYFLIPFPVCVSSKGIQKETQGKSINSC